MTTASINNRRHCIPILYTKGTHYEVGFDMGRTFSSLIHSFLNSCEPLNTQFVPAYNQAEGQKVYRSTLDLLKRNYPQYIEELEGIANGAQVPFHMLFLLHLDNTILSAVDIDKNYTGTGCSTICINQTDQAVLGHTEDALTSALNHFYIVCAHIIEPTPRGRWRTMEERFTSLCYAGHLPGYTMGYNQHGLVFTINTLSASRLMPGSTPRHFLTRALLSANGLEQAKDMLLDKGCGAADGCSINMTMLDFPHSERIFLNVEMAPSFTEEIKESLLDVETIGLHDVNVHCNTYLRLKVEESDEYMMRSSKARLQAFATYETPKTKQNVIQMLGDTTDKELPVFNDAGILRTIAVGIFDLTKKVWSLYADNPVHNEPIVNIPLVHHEYISNQYQR